MEKATAASGYGLTPMTPKKPQNTFKAELKTLLQNPNLPETLASFEHEHQLPALPITPDTPHVREVRCLLMTHHTGCILTETAQEITNPYLWYALAGLN